MGGIRKKTSKRGTTFQASKIKKKAAETRKKNSRGQKKDVTWKSKKTKDPGIPNNFPFKDKVLAEIAEQKRAAEEDRLAKKTAAKEAARAPPPPDSDEEEGGINPGIMSLLNRTAVNARSLASKAVAALMPEKESSPPPELVDNLLINTQAALDRADVVVEVIDARDPTSFRSSFLEDVVLASSTEPSTSTGWKKDKLLILLNKTDLVPREATTAWLLSLRQTFASHIASGNVKILPFKSSVMAEKPLEVGPNGMRPGLPLGKEGVLSALRGWRDEKAKVDKEEGLSVVFVGLPNVSPAIQVGKSAVINTLLGKPILPTAPLQPSSGGTINTTTTSATEVVLPSPASSSTTPEISLIDTPGLEYNDPDMSDSEEDDEEDEDEEMEDEEIQSKQEKWDILERLAAKDMLARNMGRVDKIKDSYPLVKHIVGRSNAQDLMMAYNIPAFKAGDLTAFLIELARANGRVKKHGVADVDSAARIVLRDWAFNTFPHYTTPSKADTVAKDVSLSEEEQAILAALPLKTQLRKVGKGLVKLQNGEVDGRELILDEDYLVPEAEDDDEGDDEDDEDVDESIGDSDEEDEDEAAIFDGEGEEVVFPNDVEPSESEDGDDEDEDDDEESEQEAPPPPPAGNKRKRLSTGSAAEPSTKKARVVMFASKMKGPAPKAEFATPKATPSSILKRKGRADEDSDAEEIAAPKGKKSKSKVEEVKIVKVVKEVKEVKVIPAKKTKEPKVQVAKPAKPVKAAAAPAKAITGPKPKSKATENVPAGEKPYSFDAHFF